jgi:hypothetical protein
VPADGSAIVTFLRAHMIRTVPAQDRERRKPCKSAAVGGCGGTGTDSFFQLKRRLLASDQDEQVLLACEMRTDRERTE